jgi:nicotinate-nucleotide--dimethylbenzimidazole phosphoribosyltransferase
MAMTAPEPRARPHEISIDAFLEVARRRRSIRSGFMEDVAVPDSHVEAILEAARWAPSAGNSQPWEFIVIRDRKTRYKIADLFKAQLKDKTEMEHVGRGKASHFSSGLDFKHAPVHVIVLGDPRTIECFPVRTKLDKWESHFYGSMANSILQMMLAAEVLGLSSIYVSDVASPYFSVMLRALLGVPDPLVIYHLIPLGFAEKSRTISHPRRALEAIVHRERYEQAKGRSDADIQAFVEEMSIRGRQYRW